MSLLHSNLAIYILGLGFVETLVDLVVEVDSKLTTRVTRVKETLSIGDGNRIVPVDKHVVNDVMPALTAPIANHCAPHNNFWWMVQEIVDTLLGEFRDSFWSVLFGPLQSAESKAGVKSCARIICKG